MSILWFLEGWRTPLGDKIFQFITELGQEALILAVICLLYWCLDKRFAYLLGLIYFTAGLSVQALKITFRIPRPWVLDPSFKAVESAIPAATGYSFPSGHTQSGTCLFGSLALYFKKPVLKVLSVIAFLSIGFSRMYLGVHTPKDVFVSMGLSLLITLLLYRAQKWFLDTPENHLKVSLALIVIAMAVCIYALVLLHLGSLEKKYVLDCAKAAGAGLGFAIGFFVEPKFMNFEIHTNHIWQRIVKWALGLACTVGLQKGLPLLLDESVFAEILAYMLIILWILLVYPLIFSKILGTSANKDR